MRTLRLNELQDELRAKGIPELAREDSRYYTHPRVTIVVEFPDDVLDGSAERVFEVEVSDGRKVFLIGIEDIILDCLAAYVNWDKRCEESEHAVQAITLLVAQHDRVDFDYLQEAARLRGWHEDLKHIQTCADNIRTKMGWAHLYGVQVVAGREARLCCERLGDGCGAARIRGGMLFKSSCGGRCAESRTTSLSV